MTIARGPDDFAPQTEANQRLLNALYDGNAAAPAPPPATPTSPVDADRLYGPSMLTSAFARRGPELWAAIGADTATQQQMRETFVGIKRSTQLPEGLLTRIAEAHIDGQLAAVRQNDPEAATDAFDKQVQTWNAEIRETLRSRYGAKDGEQLLARTAKFVRATPALAKILQQHGLGSRPEIVEGIAAHVFSSGYR